MNIKLVIGLTAVTVALASGCSSKPKKPATGSQETGSLAGDHSHGGKSHSHNGLPGHRHDDNISVQQGGSSGSGGGLAGSGAGGSAQGGGLGGSNNGQGGFNGGSAGSNQYGQGGGFGSGSGYGGTTKGAYTPADLRDSRSILAQRIIYFNYNQANIAPQYRKILDAHASLLRDFPNLNVRLEGHADERGSREYNVALSERRANSVLDYMKIKGTKPGQADVVGYGEEIPATFGHGEGTWSKNRRVEIIYAGE